MTEADQHAAALLEATRTLCRQKGFGVEAREIATLAGVGVASLYRRWSSKEALVREVVSEMVEEWRRGLRHVAGLVGDARLAVLGALLVSLAQLHKYGALASQATAGAVPAVYRDDVPSTELNAYFEALIQRGIEQGHFKPDLDVPYAVAAWRSLCTPGGVEALLDADAPPEQLARQTSRILMSALAP